MSTQIAPGTGSPRAPLAGLDPARLPLWQIPTFFLGVLVFLGVAAVMTLRPPREVREWDRDFAQVEQILAQPGDPPQQTLPLAESLLTRVEDRPQRAGEAHCLLGNVYFRLAEHAAPAAQIDYRALAFEQYRQAETLGLPPGQLPKVQYRMGTILVFLVGNTQRAIEYLNRSIAQGADDPAAGYALLVTCYLRLQPPDYEGALKANQKELEVTASEEAAAPVRFRRAEILFNKGLRQEAIKVLERIGPSVPPEIRYPARFLQARCCTDEELWNQAVPLWKEVLTNPGESPAGRARVLFVLGQCERKLEPPDDTGATAAWEEAVRTGGDEGQAASLSLAELHLAGPEPAAALADFRRALEKVKTERDYHNIWIDLPRVRQLLEQGCRTYRETRDFERAQQLAELSKRLAAPARAQELYGEISEAWAKDLEEQALASGKPDAVLEARKHYAQAGMAYLDASAQRAPPEQALLGWRSAQCYASAREPAQARDALQKLLKLPATLERQAEIWFALGQAYTALGQADPARQAYYKSLEYPTSPVALRVRLELADAEIQAKNYDQAEAILQQNLRATGSTPDREAHEKSLYQLGALLYQRGDCLKASILLKEAVRQYPANPEGLTARARLGECYRKLAQEVSQKLKSPEAYADVQAHLLRTRQEWLEKALEVYEKLADHLERTASKAPGPEELRLLTQALFGVAECRIDLGETTEALRLFKQLFQRYARQGESLNALRKMLQCYYALPGQEKASALPDLRSAVQTAVEDLPTLPAEIFDPQRFGSREAWQSGLNEVQRYLANQPPATTPENGR